MSSAEKKTPVLFAAGPGANHNQAGTAMRNEVLCKLVAHNICCLIMSQVELGIDPTFGGAGHTTEVRLERGTEAVAAPDALDFSDFRFSD